MSNFCFNPNHQPNPAQQIQHHKTHQTHPWLAILSSRQQLPSPVHFHFSRCSKHPHFHPLSMFFVSPKPRYLYTWHENTEQKQRAWAATAAVHLESPFAPFATKISTPSLKTSKPSPSAAMSFTNFGFFLSLPPSFHFPIVNLSIFSSFLHLLCFLLFPQFISLQQWLEYCPAGKKTSCPVCKQFCSQKNICRLYFQSMGDPSTQTTISSPKPSDADAEACSLSLSKHLSIFTGSNPDFCLWPLFCYVRLVFRHCAKRLRNWRWSFLGLILPSRISSSVSRNSVRRWCISPFLHSICFVPSGLGSGYGPKSELVWIFWWVLVAMICSVFCPNCWIWI